MGNSTPAQISARMRRIPKTAAKEGLIVQQLPPPKATAKLTLVKDASAETAADQDRHRR